MPLIKYISADGKETLLEVKNGSTVMHGAIINMVDGILAECGGALTCGTCHCYIDQAWIGITGTAKGKEKQQLYKVNTPMHNSRLSCQITIHDRLDGLIVRFPKSQVWGVQSAT